MLSISSGTTKKCFYGLFFEALETSKLFSEASFRTWNRAADKYESFNAASEKMQNRISKHILLNSKTKKKKLQCKT